MYALTKLDPEKLRNRRIVATATISVAVIAFLLLGVDPALAPVMAPLAGPIGQAVDEQIPPNPGEAVQEAPRGPAAHPVPDGPELVETVLSEPGVPADSEAVSPAASEQRVFKSRRALETIDARDFLRQGAIPK
ncbi:MAG TPA: hypothetical protein VGH20_15880 [Myxococcales bacterium]|jgi:hypothetical protein